MLSRYQQGILQLFKRQITSDLTLDFAHEFSDDNPSIDSHYVISAQSNLSSVRSPQTSPIVSLWQALQLQQLLPILSEVLRDTDTQRLWQPLMKTGREDICLQLDPSTQVFRGLDAAQISMVILLAYRLSKDAKGQITPMQERSTLTQASSRESVAHYIVDLRRHARLIDIDLTAVSDANVHWLLLTAQHLNSMQLLAIISAVPVSHESVSTHRVETSDTDNYRDNHQDRQQGSGQIDYNDNDHDTAKPAYHQYRQWLSTLHTVMLHDTIISQDEYDCLTLMSEHWLSIRQLF